MGIEAGRGDEIGGRRNENTTMDVRSYEADKIRNERIRGQRKWGKWQRKSRKEG